MSRFTIKSNRASQRTAANKLQRRVERNFGRERKVATLQGASGGVRMSEVLKSFVEPYMRFTTDLESVKRGHMTALIGWNMALFPKAERQRHLDQLTANLKLDAQSIADMKAIVVDLVDRLHFLLTL